MSTRNAVLVTVTAGALMAVVVTVILFFAWRVTP